LAFFEVLEVVEGVDEQVRGTREVLERPVELFKKIYFFREEGHT
jgi:hypothetical protein